MRYLSLGAGVQSSAVLILCEQGKLPRPDVAIFADTQDEPAWVYDQLERLKSYATIPIEVVSDGKLSADVIGRHNGTRSRCAAIPAFTLGADGRAAPLRRQCTREYKITPIERRVREFMGYKKYQRIKETATAMIGISTDEATRMRPSRTGWIVNSYPLIDLGLSRRDCLRISADAGLSEPKKSSCVFCPYHSDSYWLDLRTNHPKEFERAVSFDASIRDMSASGAKSPVYLHRTLTPLEDVELKHENQIDLFDEECEGVCGV